jgi:hypothetical protein
MLNVLQCRFEHPYSVAEHPNHIRHLLGAKLAVSGLEEPLDLSEFVIIPVHTGLQFLSRASVAATDLIGGDEHAKHSKVRT